MQVPASAQLFQALSSLTQPGAAQFTGADQTQITKAGAKAATGVEPQAAAAVPQSQPDQDAGIEDVQEMMQRGIGAMVLMNG